MQSTQQRGECLAGTSFSPFCRKESQFGLAVGGDDLVHFSMWGLKEGCGVKERLKKSG